MPRSKSIATPPTALTPLDIKKPLLVTIPQAAQMLSTTVWQVRSLVWGKKLPVVKLGRRFLFRPADLEAFADTRGGAAC